MMRMKHLSSVNLFASQEFDVEETLYELSSLEATLNSNVYYPLNLRPSISFSPILAF